MARPILLVEDNVSVELLTAVNRAASGESKKAHAAAAPRHS